MKNRELHGTRMMYHDAAVSVRAIVSDLGYGTDVRIFGRKKFYDTDRYGIVVLKTEL